MTTYITQEQAVALSKTIDWTFHPVHATELCNAAIQHHRDSLMAGVVLPELPDPDYLGADGVGDIFGYEERHMQDYARQAIADALAKQVPQGYKLVPIKANAAMLKVATNTWKRPDSIPVGASYWSFSYGQAKEVWDNMIAAAPDPKEAV